MIGIARPLILEVLLYDCGAGPGKCLAFGAKLRAKKGEEGLRREARGHEVKGGFLIDKLRFSSYCFGVRLRRISRRMRALGRLGTGRDGFGIVGCWFCLGTDVENLRCSMDDGHMAIEIMPPVVGSFRNFLHKLLSGEIRIKDAEKLVEEKA